MANYRQSISLASEIRASEISGEQFRKQEKHTFEILREALLVLRVEDKVVIESVYHDAPATVGQVFHLDSPNRVERKDEIAILLVLDVGVTVVSIDVDTV
ncbi:hypothetical protein HFX_6309 (plasmid) [Haloferax mediterranei ATCC 33500]|uniref:Uncharacterized protein n=1 Tax=Haloferax mediterranei (strain ATCC 33500 / DSM 1411 / JCM 8866 / NBRC 14739 / NCIMB 2177 / R-4) TaxID=523841 RepID=I3RB21_HALMT|nr:hypothetical protein HFX_6309 [Haloferax mediterranei ATCC 33500]